MAAVRDPAFWRRFSMAVHLDEEQAAQTGVRPGLKHSDSWLDRQQKKRSRRTVICWIFWLSFTVVVAAIIIVVLYLKGAGYIK